ncbi:ethanolamine ammonia-lyase subunit EutC [Massilia antarctica]|uniref:ethanolamine ammonia-lyase subunit EutC n=1 Tax=Massilia antarctica TaxID=2765360 RepID=UPI0006BB7464|nr:ethanolamine ammonia-lyase subunit EutC [Massilia sp. H27-R4]MCY0912583.1 ethanolamine ammonia-lyase subunit EutC [Massilia sp. H27-R4]CUI03638.1 Ethanolamine ammonia-lyase light chain [Janthinobacterium sp. CG23_2]CUU27424.1 Ethanolamine ammonia-lyase light chain [Janthinobacterium sp. CG23_2]
MNDPKHVLSNPWQALRGLTQARIALGRSGVSVPTSAQLDFQLAHARARDAVHMALDTDALAAALAATGYACLTAHSACPDRATYLQRPDLGRMLDAPSRAALAAAAPASCDLALVIGDGLSALAIEQNAQPFLAVLLARLQQEQWKVGPIVIASQARVAIGDEIGQWLNARAVAVLIGERPGLSSPDSMGIYMSWAPRVGLSDADRNCISNVRPAGLGYDEAAYRLHYLLTQARQRGMSGVLLKDDTVADDLALSAGKGNFLLR